MFTGLVEALAVVERAEPDGAGGLVLHIHEPTIAPQLTLGESVAVNGVCLTVIDRSDTVFAFQAGPETLLKTDLGNLQAGQHVNLERALRFGDRLGGHIVQGHVDGLGRIRERITQGEWETVWFDAPPELLAQMVPKGSIAVDGVSLTLVDVTADGFSIMLIPHTRAVTTLGLKPTGTVVNLETDLFAKYVAKAMLSYGNREANR